MWKKFAEWGQWPNVWGIVSVPVTAGVLIGLPLLLLIAFGQVHL